MKAKTAGTILNRSISSAVLPPEETSAGKLQCVKKSYKPKLEVYNTETGRRPDAANKSQLNPRGLAVQAASAGPKLRQGSADARVESTTSQQVFTSHNIPATSTHQPND